MDFSKLLERIKNNHGSNDQFRNFLSGQFIFDAVTGAGEKINLFRRFGCLSTKPEERKLFEDFLAKYNIKEVSNEGRFENKDNEEDTIINKHISSKLYVNEQCVLFVYSEEGDGSIQIITPNILIFEDFEKIAHVFKHLPPEPTKEVFVLVTSQQGIELRSIGYNAVKIDFDNYSSLIHDKINSITEDLKSRFPLGRISILEGDPGTGKTFLIRGFVDAAPQATYVFIPPSMIRSLSDPSLIGTLLDLKSTNTEVVSPVVLLCEDADEILTKRGSDNMPSISSMLNLTSGIIGETIDIRIVATTNAKRVDIDEAILRPGRLSQYVEVPLLSIEEANKVFSNLMPDKDIPNWNKELGIVEKTIGFASNNKTETKIKLADIYLIAKKLGYQPKEIKAKMTPSKTGALEKAIAEHLYDSAPETVDYE